MKGKLFLMLFAVPFFGIGVWMLLSLSGVLTDAWRMQDWVATEAVLTRAGYETNSGDDADTYEAFAEYTYTFEGVRYRGDRAMIASGGDNIGDFQRDLGNRLERAMLAGEPVTAWVDPERPTESVIDRTLRWGLVGFKSIFVLAFGGFGLGMLIFAWRVPREKDKSLPLYGDQPWLLNDKWQTPEIRSDSKTAMYGAWFFAAVWNLISAPLPFLLYPEIVEKENYFALIGLLFPLVGIGLLVWAIRRTREWRRFGPTPVTLDPFPGSIGGHVGGTIDLELPYDSSRQFHLTLTNIHSYESGSGDDRSQREDAQWQDAMVARAEPGPKGTRLSFRFDVPGDLRESDTEQDDSYYLWRLGLSADLDGTDLDRSYEIPVFATAKPSQLLSDRAVEQARSAQSEVDDAGIRRLFELGFGPTGRRMYFPMGRHLSPAIGGCIAGLVLAGAGYWMIAEEDMWLFGGVFAAVGGLILLIALYMTLNSLEVRQAGSDIVTTRRLLGIAIRRQRFSRGDFERFESDSSFQSQSGGKHVMYYSVLAVVRDGRRITVGEGFRGENEARAAMRLVAREFGLPGPPGRRAKADADTLLGPEVLT